MDRESPPPLSLADDACLATHFGDCAQCTRDDPVAITCCARCRTTGRKCRRRAVPGKRHCYQHISCSARIVKTVPEWFYNAIMRDIDYKLTPALLFRERYHLLLRYLPTAASAARLLAQIDAEVAERTAQLTECYVGACADIGHFQVRNNLLVWSAALELYRDWVFPGVSPKTTH